jgi:hypothetical protein
MSQPQQQQSMPTAEEIKKIKIQQMLGGRNG